MKYLLIIFLVLSLTSCANLRSIGNNESYVIVPCAEDAPGAICKSNACHQRYIVGAKSDGKVNFSSPSGVSISVDNRGREGLLESFIQLYGLKVMDND